MGNQSTLTSEGRKFFEKELTTVDENKSKASTQIPVAPTPIQEFHPFKTILKSYEDVKDDGINGIASPLSPLSDEEGDPFVEGIGQGEEKSEQEDIFDLDDENPFNEILESSNEYFPQLKIQAPSARICPCCLKVVYLNPKGSKITSCMFCSREFCHICLHAPIKSTSGDSVNSVPSHYHDQGKGVCNECRFPKLLKQTSKKTPLVFPVQSVENAKFWFVGRTGVYILEGKKEGEQFWKPKPSKQELEELKRIAGHWAKDI